MAQGPLRRGTSEEVIVVPPSRAGYKSKLDPENQSESKKKCHPKNQTGGCQSCDPFVRKSCGTVWNGPFRWVFLWEKGYQETDSVVSSVTTKVKGVTLTNTSTLGARIWDVADYVIPPQGENTVFVMTNVILTLNQSQGRCPELPDDQTKCEVKNNCVPGYVSTHSSGIQTGECVPYNSSIKTCEVFAWCPVEDDYHIPKPAFLQEAENFTLLVKNNIWYRKFNFSKRNILPTINSTYLKNCIYDAQTDPFCPIFRLGKIIEAAGQDFQEMAVEGGVMALQINWDCNLDRAASHCVPKYSFRRLDNKDSAHTVSPGYNFRSKERNLCYTPGFHQTQP